MNNLNNPEGRWAPVPAVVSALARFNSAKENLASLERQVNSAQCEVSNATQELGKIAVPVDAKPGEQFNVWFGSQLLSVKVQSNSYEIEWRKGGKV